MANKIIVSREEDLEHIAKEAVYLLGKVLEAFDNWKNEYGSKRKNDLEDWRQRSINFLKDPMSRTDTKVATVFSVKKEDNTTNNAGA